MFPAAVAWFILTAFSLFLAGLIVVGVCVLVADYFGADWSTTASQKTDGLYPGPDDPIP